MITSVGFGQNRTNCRNNFGAHFSPDAQEMLFKHVDELTKQNMDVIELVEKHPKSKHIDLDLKLRDDRGLGSVGFYDLYASSSKYPNAGKKKQTQGALGNVVEWLKGAVNLDVTFADVERRLQMAQDENLKKTMRLRSIFGQPEEGTKVEA